MKVNLIAIGNKMPAWVDAGINQYRKRLPGNFELVLTELPLARRSKSNSDVKKYCDVEGKSLLKAVAASDYLVALDVKGLSLSTEAMANRVSRIQDSGKHIALLVGGPDGLSDECLGAADEIWSLSALTLPHTLVRIVVAEQVYRVWSFLAGHPYHRE